MTPYQNIEVTDEYIVRTFDKTIDPTELKWHRDNESRLVEVIGKTDWKIQLDNELPTDLSKPVFILKHHWHRVIKGNGILTVKIHLVKK